MTLLGSIPVVQWFNFAGSATDALTSFAAPGAGIAWQIVGFGTGVGGNIIFENVSDNSDIAGVIGVTNIPFATPLLWGGTGFGRAIVNDGIQLNHSVATNGYLICKKVNI